MKPVAVDIGNTRFKLEFQGTVFSLRDTTELAQTVAEFSMSADETFSWHISSVHRPTLARLCDWLQNFRPNDAVKILDHTMLPISVDVEFPDRVGIDRLLAAVAANRRRAPGRGAIIADLGTAVTVDFVDETGVFRGGAILPGMEIAADALHAYTDALPRVQFPSLGGVPDNSPPPEGWLRSSRGGEFPSSGGVPRKRRGGLPYETGSPNHPAPDEGNERRNTRAYHDLPYNPKLKERAKELRKAENLSEVLLWNQLKNRKFNGFDFDRQKIIGNYIVDFYCVNCGVVIEIDGDSHVGKREYDAERDAFLRGLGLTIIRIGDAEVKRNMDGVMAVLYNHPALKGTPPEEGNSPPRLLRRHPSEGGESPPRPSGTPPKEGNYPPVGRNTQAAIQAGIYWGTVGAIRELAAQMTKNLPYRPHIFLTGGAANFVARDLGAPPEYEFFPEMVLEGIRETISSYSS